MVFQGGFALEEPAGQLQEGGRMVTGDGKCGVMQGVRLDEGAVEVDAERWQRGDVESGGRVMQKGPSLRLRRYWNKCALCCVVFDMNAVMTKALGRPTSLSFILRYLAQ
jgi:hypothetical protein